MQVGSIVFTPLQTLAMILAIAAGTALTRFLPFWLFPDSKKAPPVISYLGDALPPAMIGLLVVYCLKDVRISPLPLPELLAIAGIAGLHLWKRNVLLSIAGGTLIYCLMVA